MSVLIKGMEMSKDKAIAVVIHPDGTAYSAEMFAGVCTEYLADCTAVPVPPHGRCIDADALISKIIAIPFSRDAERVGVISYEEIFDAIIYELRKAPTIIETEEASDETL